MSVRLCCIGESGGIWSQDDFDFYFSVPLLACWIICASAVM